ncbi:MAG: hypothetical protein LBD94_02520 [Rickettsiales bacterium]|jgi:Sec-independent protein translocase protein TatA|nr:hypothetical protein [Rickettsiales bacterium]
MFGISGAEFLIVLIIAIAVVPAKNWPDVARMVGKFVRYVKNIIGKLQDGIDNFENEVAKDLPLDNLSQKTMDDMIETFSTPVKKRRKK